MADLSITASQVLPGTNATIQRMTASETITAGQAVYDQGSRLMGLAQNDVDAASATVKGVALNAASTGQPVDILTSGPITLGAGAAPAQGTIYVLSTTAGGIAPAADLGSTNRVSILGVGIGSNQVQVDIQNSGVQIP